MGSRYEGPELESWALGMLLHILVRGEKPFKELWQVAEFNYSAPIDTSKDLNNLLNGLLSKEPKDRFTLNTVTAHPWTTQPVDASNYKFSDIIPCCKYFTYY